MKKNDIINILGIEKENIKAHKSDIKDFKKLLKMGFNKNDIYLKGDHPFYTNNKEIKFIYNNLIVVR